MINAHSRTDFEIIIRNFSSSCSVYILDSVFTIDCWCLVVVFSMKVLQLEFMRMIIAT